MDDYKHICPVCKSSGKTTFLQLRQINFTTATYLCKDIKCTYPQGHSWIYVDRNIFNEDESDSDSSNISDEVNADIEKILLSIQNSNEINVAECLNNNKMNIDVQAESEIAYDRDKHKLDRIKFSPSQQTVRSEETYDLLKNIQHSKGINGSKHLNNYDLNVNTETDIIFDRDRHNLVCDKYSTSQVSPPIDETCDEVTIVDTKTEVDNVKIEVPDELLNSLSTTNLEPKVLASGATNSEIVDINVFKDTTSEVTDIQYHLVKNDKEPNKFNIDFGMIARTEDISKLKGKQSVAGNSSAQNPSVNSNQEQNKCKLDIEMVDQTSDVLDEQYNSIKSEQQKKLKLDPMKRKKKKTDASIIDIREHQKNPKKGICVVDLQTGKLSKLKKRQNTDKVPIDVSKIINVSKSINSEQNVTPETIDLSDSKEEKEKIAPRKSTDVDLLEVLLKDDNLKDDTVETNNKSNILKENSTKIITRSKRKDTLDLILPFVEDVEFVTPRPIIENAFKRKLKLQPKRSKQSSFYFSEAILEEALQTANDNKEIEPPKNRSLISLLFEPNNSEVTDTKSAAAFKGFKFSSEIVKPSTPDLPKKKSVKENPTKDLVEHIQTPQKEKKNNKRLRDKNVEQIQSKSETEIVKNDANTSISSNGENKDNTGLGLGDLTLAELFDNIDGLGAVSVPNNSVDIAEVDDWLTSLCE